jgi:AraC family transcriptional activator of tynA and feaB
MQQTEVCVEAIGGNDEPSDEFNAKPALEYEEWKVLLRTLCGRYSPEGVEPNAFQGSVRPAHICGLEAVDLSCNAHRIERTYSDVRLDGTDHYGAIFQFAGRSIVVQNDRVTELTVGDVALVDSTQPVTYISENRPGRWLGLNLPRRSLVSHLGLEPVGGLRRRGETWRRWRWRCGEIEREISNVQQWSGIGAKPRFGE